MPADRHEPISRRALLARGGLGGAALLVGACGETSARSARQGPTDHDVVIVGAGAAGLAAARALATQDADVIVLEARDRIGGRIDTDTSLGLPVELGAAWIHGPEGGNPLTALARRAGMRTRRTRYATGLVLAKGDAARRAERESDLAAEYGAGPDELSPQLFDEDEEYPGGDALILNGYDRLPQLLARGLAIRTGVAVSAVRDDPQQRRVHVSLAGGESITARALVLSVPLGVLQAASVTIEPRFPGAVSHAIARLGMGRVEKTVLRFDEPFWPVDAELLVHAARPGETISEQLSLLASHGVPILVGFGGGHRADRHARMSDDEAVASALLPLRRAFGASAVPDPVAALRTRWTRDPHALGAYSFAGRATREADRRILRRALWDGRLMLAGEHTDEHYPATVHGALRSGRRAAQALIRLA